MMVAVGLLPHENKVSVLHMGLSQTPKCDAALDLDSEPVKCKDVLTVRCGWRTWQCRPVFSQHNLNSDKHKLERFLPTGGAYFCASVLGPVTYAPCPVLMFRGSQLMATGTMLGADADRIVIKRIIMTGFPSRVHKRHCIVKHMFYNPDDVKWFKPAGLTTKHGLQGNIVQSVGDHGTMKCLFNAPIKQHDTVCLPLYKRMYPKFAPTETEDGNKSNLVVL
jgi:pre-rRNA-processing protein TSR1